MDATVICMSQDNSPGMSTGRGILTEYERECLAGEHAKQREYESRSRIRSRLEGPLAQDIEHLKEHDPDLLKELREVVCDESTDHGT